MSPLAWYLIGTATYVASMIIAYVLGCCDGLSKGVNLHLQAETERERLRRLGAALGSSKPTTT